MSKTRKPIIGLSVQYISSDGEPRAAIIIDVLESGAVNLAVFGRDARGFGAGPLFVPAVPYGEEAQAGTWREIT